MLSRLVNILFRTRYTDLCYGYNAFRVHLLPMLDLPPTEPACESTAGMLWGDGFEIETLINVRVAHAGVRIAEVGSTELPRLHGVSNLRALPDGIRVLRTILAERHRASRAAPRAVTSAPLRNEVRAQAVRDEVAIAETT